jgi:hypothetical protein
MTVFYLPVLNCLLHLSLIRSNWAIPNISGVTRGALGIHESVCEQQVFGPSWPLSLSLFPSSLILSVTASIDESAIAAALGALVP